MKEKLVKETGDFIRRRTVAILAFADHIEPEDAPIHDVGIKFSSKDVAELIDRIRQAIEDGEILLTKAPPKLPGEVGRKIYDKDKPTVPIAWADEMMHTGARIWIALRPEEER